MHTRTKQLLIGASTVAAAGYGLHAFFRQRRRFGLRGKVALVTGGSSGLGLAIARELGREGCRVAIAARGEAKLRAAAEELQAAGVETFARVADVTDPASTTALLAAVRDRFGEIDILVNCAGMIAVGPIGVTEPADFELLMQTNFHGPVRLTLGVIGSMRKRRGGRVVNIASFGGKIPVPHMATYTSSKFALVGFSQSLRVELLQDNVFVTTVCPGLIRTGSAGNALFKGDPEAEHAWFAAGAVTPVITIEPSRLARQIVDAMRFGGAELMSPFPTGLQAKLFAVAPSIGTGVLSLVERLLPQGSQRRLTRGRQLESDRGVVAARQRIAERRYNQI